MNENYLRGIKQRMNNQNNFKTFFRIAICVAISILFTVQCRMEPPKAGDGNTSMVMRPGGNGGNGNGGPGTGMMMETENFNFSISSRGSVATSLQQLRRSVYFNKSNGFFSIAESFNVNFMLNVVASNSSGNVLEENFESSIANVYNFSLNIMGSGGTMASFSQARYDRYDAGNQLGVFNISGMITGDFSNTNVTDLISEVEDFVNDGIPSLVPMLTITGAETGEINTDIMILMPNLNLDSNLCTGTTPPTIEFCGMGRTVDGTERPYILTNVQQLQKVGDSLRDSYIVVNDINASVTSTWRGCSGNGSSSSTTKILTSSSSGLSDTNNCNGFIPIGNSTGNSFTGNFDGNGFTIANLSISVDSGYLGLFGAIGGSARISNIGLVDNVVDYTGSSGGQIYVGSLVGQQSGGTIISSYATGSAHGGDAARDRVGGLVGHQLGGNIVASYATGSADGGGGFLNLVGGLLGHQDGGKIIASYATGDADGGSQGSNSVGGLVGRQDGGNIVASYATGDLDGGDGTNDEVGGLVGRQDRGNIIASYATGDADGGIGSDRVGGLVGRIESITIIASYATGNTFGGGGSVNQDYVGGLVGFQANLPGGRGDTGSNATIIASYATGNADGGIGASGSVGGLMGRQESPSIANIIACYATGDADGGDNISDAVGSLTGNIVNTPIASYGFGGSANGEIDGLDHSTDSGDTFAAHAQDGNASNGVLNISSAGSVWSNSSYLVSSTSYNISSIWDFQNRVIGTRGGGPTLRYGEYHRGLVGLCNELLTIELPSSYYTGSTMGMMLRCGEQLPNQSR